MNMAKHIGLSIVATILVVCAIDAVGRLPISGVDSVAVISAAQARVGRPLTPVSVAGTARRTTRRCAAGVYDC
jgi:hypothetical protein